MLHPNDADEPQLVDVITTVPAGPARRVRPYLRLFGFVLLVASGWAFIFATGLIDSFQEEKLRALVTQAGSFGVLLFVAAFVAAQILQLPGSVFIAVAGVAWGWSLGATIAWAASVIAVSVNFALVKTVGGDVLIAMDRPLIAKILRHLHTRPRLTVLVARALFMTSPWLSATLALAAVRQRDHLLASAIGMAPQILIWTVAADLLV